jgi:hypothetical protein
MKVLMSSYKMEVLTMYRSSSNLSIPCFRSRGLVWIMVAVFCFSFIPSVSRAQQPTATINTLNGTVLVNGQEQGKGFALSAGDVIETQAGARVVLELSDGSQLELGENTKVDVAVLSQTATGARTSKVKLMWGWIRAKLSPSHQQEGSAFDIETPNALIGVKFSQPEVEVGYNQEKQETTAKALTVALIILNLLTGERMVIPVGSTAIITALGIKIAAGTAGAVLSTKTIAIGAGALAAAGGIAVAASGGGGGDGSSGDSDTIDPVGIWNVTRNWSSPKTASEAQCVLSSQSAIFDIRADLTWYFSDFNTSSLLGWWRMPDSKRKLSDGTWIELGDNEGLAVWRGEFEGKNRISGTMQTVDGSDSGTWSAVRE